ncbi:hypothetical protein EY643_13420 [Halioglobus maricola]|uniref:TonB C-terminal domain-containing protein n=1 Tax=Halioglobus maricola TaxID=2601894 RepID=A0A5P9NMT0_9GAMM|nr:hypothetical protein EY643_13420 [Halioglobus maricola]
MAALLASLPAVAAPVGYGEYFLRADDVAEYSTVSVARAPASDVDQYALQLQQAELLGGPYADGLAEPLAQMGNQLFAVGNYPAAVATYRRALHILRVNDGLYSERQLPVLRQLILAFRETRDWETLDERYEYFFRVYGQGQAPYTEVRMRAALEYLRWQREALHLKLGEKSRRLLDLIALNERLVRELMSDPAAPDLWKREFVTSQMENFYLIRDVLQPYIQQAEFSNSKDIFGAKPLALDIEQQRMSMMLRSAPAKGRQVLQDLRLLAGDDVLESARIDLHLGDWYHWNGNRYRAAQAYTSVEEQLRAAGEEEVLAQWLGQPVELPANGAFVRPPSSDQTGNVRARFDVSSQGDVRDIQATAVEGMEVDTSLFRRRLAATLFRPRWEGGRPVASSGIERNYQILP